MIKVIRGYKLKKGADVQPIFLKLRSHALTYPGYVGGENLVSEQNSRIVAMLSTWENAEQWSLWETSTTVQGILKEIYSLIIGKPRLTIYRIMTTTKTINWVG
ncbi:antibiotic biosynthesis monooxygenase family protein [Chloroflexota bacterium]